MSHQIAHAFRQSRGGNGNARALVQALSVDARSRLGGSLALPIRVLPIRALPEWAVLVRVLPLIVAAVLFATPAFGIEHGAELLPPSTLFYAEVSDPPRVVEFVLTHPATVHLQSLPQYQEAVDSDEYRKFLDAVQYIETQLGMGWQDAFRQVTQGGVVLAFDAETDGVALIARAGKESQLAVIKDTFVRLAREDAAQKGEPMPFDEQDYRGIPIYRTDEGGFATYERWLIVVNNTALGRDVLDTLLDGRDSSLADQSDFQQAQRQQGREALVWLYGNVGAIRDAGGAPKLFCGKADGPIGELLFGGILEVLQHAPRVSAAIREDQSKLSLDVSMPFDRSWITDKREHYFGSGGLGQAPAVGDIPDLLFALAVHRNVSEMWLRAGDLFDEQVNDQVTAADHKLSTLFAGRDFGEEILGSFSPRLQIVVARQTFSDGQPVPAIKLPAVALVAEGKDGGATSRELRRIFQSLIGFLNVMGAADDQPQLWVQTDVLEMGEILFAEFVPQSGEETQKDATIHFNFSPAIAFPRDRMIIASTVGLARELAAQDPAPPTPANRQCVNLSMDLSADVLTSVLRDNLTPLISQNMHDEGHSRAEATADITTFVDLLSLLQDVSFTLSTSDDALTLSLDVDFAEAVSP